MTDPEQQAAQPLPPAAWYPDPAGGGGQRWWDGTQWTQHTAPAPYAAVAPAPPQKLPEGTPVGTVFFWILALLPLLTVIALLVWDVDTYGRSLVTDFAPDQGYGPFTVFSAGYFTLMAVGWATNIATIVLAYFDWRTLTRRGMDRPFHWAWSFLALVSAGVLVYVIGRSVVVRRRSGRGLAPLWVFIGVEVLAIVVGVVKIAMLVSALVGSIDLSASPTFNS